jgi:hypothetical protein
VIGPEDEAEGVDQKESGTGHEVMIPPCDEPIFGETALIRPQKRLQGVA